LKNRPHRNICDGGGFLFWLLFSNLKETEVAQRGWKNGIAALRVALPTLTLEAA
jgi:hypothetical protein